MSRRTKTPKDPKAAVAAKSRKFEAAFPRHPRHDQLIAHATVRHAEELRRSEDGTLSTEAAAQRAADEFNAAIHAVIFPPAEDRFYFVWANVPTVATLAQHVQAEWRAASLGTYGSTPPLNYTAKL